MNVENLNTVDPFAEEQDFGINDDDLGDQHIVHIRVQQRNGRKMLTTVQGIEKYADPREAMKDFRKLFACNGTMPNPKKDADKTKKASKTKKGDKAKKVDKEDEADDVIQLQGDQRVGVVKFLVGRGVRKDLIKIHGF